jgi:hypothetical protein
MTYGLCQFFGGGRSKKVSIIRTEWINWRLMTNWKDFKRPIEKIL